MSTNTTNYNLVKPGLNETADIEVINQNMDIIDTGLKNVSDKSDGKISKSLATAANQFLLSSSVGQFVVKTVDEIKSLLGLKGAAEKEFNTAGGVASYDAVQSHLSDYVRQPGYAIATGAANTYLVTLNPAPATFGEGLGIILKIHAANTGPSTLNVNGLGAKPIIDSKGYQIQAGKLLYGRIYSLKYDGANFQLQGEGGEIPKLPNLVKNGSFENDLNCWGWNLVSVSADKSYNGTKSLNFNNNGSQYYYIFQDIDVSGGHKIYMTCMAYLTSCAGVNGLYITPSNPEGTEGYGAVYVDPSLLNQWQRISTIVTLPAGNTKIRFRAYSYNTVASGYIDATMAFDLTELYGVGNEPTKEEIDAIIQKYGGWWDSDLTTLTADANLANGYALISGYTVYSKGQKITGQMVNRNYSAGNAPTGASSYKSDGAGKLYISPQNGYYADEVNANQYGPIFINDPNFIPANIVSGKSIFGLAGAFTGKRWAKGTITSSSGASKTFYYLNGTTFPSPHVIVSGLDFKPSTIIVKGMNSSYPYMTIYEELGGDYTWAIKMFYANNSSVFSANVSNVRGDIGDASITNTEFILPVMLNSTIHSWEAYE